MQAQHLIQISFSLVTSSKSIDPIGQRFAQSLQFIQLLFVFGLTFLISIGWPFHPLAYNIFYKGYFPLQILFLLFFHL